MSSGNRPGRIAIDDRSGCTLIAHHTANKVRSDDVCMGIAVIDASLVLTHQSPNGILIAAYAPGRKASVDGSIIPAHQSTTPGASGYCACGIAVSDSSAGFVSACDATQAVSCNAGAGSRDSAGKSAAYDGAGIVVSADSSTCGCIADVDCCRRTAILDAAIIVTHYRACIGITEDTASAAQIQVFDSAPNGSHSKQTVIASVISCAEVGDSVPISVQTTVKHIGVVSNGKPPIGAPGCIPFSAWR